MAEPATNPEMTRPMDTPMERKQVYNAITAPRSCRKNMSATVMGAIVSAAPAPNPMRILTMCQLACSVRLLGYKRRGRSYRPAKNPEKDFSKMSQIAVAYRRGEISPNVSPASSK